jgi:hypothetical protein
MKYFTATWEEGTPYYPTDCPFATLEELREDVASIDVGLAAGQHRVVLGSIEDHTDPPQGPQDLDWSTWEKIETVWAGELEG